MECVLGYFLISVYIRKTLRILLKGYQMFISVWKTSE